MVGWVRKASSHRRQKASVSVQAVIREIVSSTVVDGDDLGIIRSTSTSRAERERIRDLIVIAFLRCLLLLIPTVDLV